LEPASPTGRYEYIPTGEMLPQVTSVLQITALPSPVCRREFSKLWIRP
jgi:hypothetical protein